MPSILFMPGLLVDLDVAKSHRRVIRQATLDAAFLADPNRVRPQAHLDAIAWKLNTRPRKSMGF